jgi:mannose/cellobiose epimerase-like protein (N-acyl-D-glucosamine 2-epimerase family)
MIYGPLLYRDPVYAAMDEWDRMHEAGERLERAVASELDELMHDDGSVHEAIAENADTVHRALLELTQHPERAPDISARLWRVIRSHLEPIARRAAERETS